MSTKSFAAFVTAFATAVSASALAQQPGTPPCPAVRDVLITNGKIHTMNAANGIVDSVRIGRG